MKKRYNSGANSVGVIIAVILLILSGVYSFFVGEELPGVVLLVAGFLLAVSGIVIAGISKKDFSEYVKMITSQREGMSSDAISKFPLPMAVLMPISRRSSIRMGLPTYTCRVRNNPSLPAI